MRRALLMLDKKAKLDSLSQFYKTTRKGAVLSLGKTLKSPKIIPGKASVV